MEVNSFDCFDLDQTIGEITAALRVNLTQIQAAVGLLDEGNTIPFFARYRKEATRGLDEVALRQIDDALAKARELAQRKTTILKTIHEQGQLTPELQKQIQSCSDRQLLEALYLPFKPERRTRATTARERGLQPLADLLLRQERLNCSKTAVLKPYVNAEKGVADEDAALQGACDILAEQWSQHPPLRQWLLKQANDYGLIASSVKRGKQAAASKFEMYFDHQEPVKRVPSHRLLAMNRGESEGLLKVSLKMDDEFVLANIKPELAHNRQFEFYRELQITVEDCYERLLLPAIQSIVFENLKSKADEEAIAVFASNLRELLLAAPAGPQMTIGVDPGFRTGCKLAVVDGRDPRREFKVAQFAEGINELKDLQVGMVLEGVITNVTKFGAFVDIGVHQDGLIHVSQLANTFIQDPSEVVAVGDLVRVKVLEVDLDRKRIAVSRKQAM